MTLVGRAVSSESGETYAACDVFHACVTDMAADSYAYVHIYVQTFTVSIYMGKRICIDQHVSPRAGGANVQLCLCMSIRAYVV